MCISIVPDRLLHRHLTLSLLCGDIELAWAAHRPSLRWSPWLQWTASSDHRPCPSPSSTSLMRSAGKSFRLLGSLGVFSSETSILMYLHSSAPSRRKYVDWTMLS